MTIANGAIVGSGVSSLVGASGEVKTDQLNWKVSNKQYSLPPSTPNFISSLFEQRTKFMIVSPNFLPGCAQPTSAASAPRW